MATINAATPLLPSSMFSPLPDLESEFKARLDWEIWRQSHHHITEFTEPEAQNIVWLIQHGVGPLLLVLMGIKGLVDWWANRGGGCNLSPPVSPTFGQVIPGGATGDYGLGLYQKSNSNYPSFGLASFGLGGFNYQDGSGLADSRIPPQVKKRTRVYGMKKPRRVPAARFRRELAIAKSNAPAAAVVVKETAQPKPTAAGMLAAGVSAELATKPAVPQPSASIVTTSLDSPALAEQAAPVARPAVQTRRRKKGGKKPAWKHDLYIDFVQKSAERDPDPLTGADRIALCGNHVPKKMKSKRPKESPLKYSRRWAKMRRGLLNACAIRLRRELKSNGMSLREYGVFLDHETAPPARKDRVVNK